jgi:hypothetical protein
MTTDQILSWVVTAIGISGFFLAGRKVWWCWYVNIACQVFWALYAYFSETPAFYVASAFYFIVFTINAIKWTKEHFSTRAEVEQGLYRTKAVPIDAKHFEGGFDSANEMLNWLESYEIKAWWKEPAASRLNKHGLYIKEQPETLRILDRQGTWDVSPGEYVVLGSNNAVYIFQADAFESAYERVT